MSATLKSPQKRLRVQLAVALALLIAGIALLHIGTDQETAAQKADRLSIEQGIRIAFADPTAFFVPPYEPSSAILEGIELASTDADSAISALKGVERAVRQYPKGFVAKLVGAIFIAGEIRIGGAIAGGTIGPKWIILAAPARIGSEGIYATSFIGVHHELSSFVMRHDPTTWQEWTQFSPPKWSYTTTPRDTIARATEPAPDLSTGFLSAYGSSSIENDFNVYAESIFSEPARVSKLAREYELIRRKVAVVMAAYVEIDSRMQEVFRELGLGG